MKQTKENDSIFSIDKVFFSKTDLKSIIQYASKTFYEISKYHPKEIVGKSHNILRHPDMPKIIFHYFWKFLLANRPFVGYIKNRAKDGSSYWVFSITFPIFDKEKVGYLSIRIKPTTKYFHIVEELYTKLLKAQNENQNVEKLFLDSLKELGFQSYEDFMIAALEEEFNSKKEYFKIDIDSKLFEKAPHFRTIYENAKIIETIYHSLYERRIKFFIQLDKTLQEKFKYIYEITDDLALIALNSSVESHKIGSLGASFAVVSNEIKKDSEKIGDLILHLRKNIDTLLGNIKYVVLHLLSLNIEIFALLYSIKETLEDEKESLQKELERIYDFVLVMRLSLQEIAKQMKLIEQNLDMTLKDVSKVERLIKELHYIQINGLIEAAKLNDEKFSIIFNQVKELVIRTNKVIEEVFPLFYKSLQYAKDITENIEEVKEYVDLLH